VSKFTASSIIGSTLKAAFGETPFAASERRRVSQSLPERRKMRGDSSEETAVEMISSAVGKKKTPVEIFSTAVEKKISALEKISLTAGKKKLGISSEEIPRSSVVGAVNRFGEGRGRAL